MAEREIGSPEDMRRHFRDLTSRPMDVGPTLQRWRAAKRITWMLLLAGAFLFYYLVNKLLEAVSMLK